MFIEGYLDRQLTASATAQQATQISSAVQYSDVDVRDLLYVTALTADQQNLAGSDEFDFRITGQIEGAITPPPTMYYRGLSLNLGALSLEENYGRWISETNPIAIGTAQ